jgi:hypothetical protein
MVFLVSLCSLLLTQNLDAAAPQEGGRIPISVKWVESRQDDGRVRLVAEVRRVAFSQLPVQVSVVVPDGVILISGQKERILPAADGSTSTKLEYEFGFTHIPLEDLIITADIDVEGFRYHGRDAYRFGRPQPEPMVVPTEPKERKFGRLKIRAVPVDRVNAR